MSLLKSWMTEILLDVTNTEMQSIAKEVFQYEKGSIAWEQAHTKIENSFY